MVTVTLIEMLKMSINPVRKWFSNWWLRYQVSELDMHIDVVQRDIDLLHGTLRELQKDRMILNNLRKKY